VREDLKIGDVAEACQKYDIAPILFNHWKDEVEQGAQGQAPKLVAETLAISRSSLYDRKRRHNSRADRTDDERIVAACGEKPAYRRVARVFAAQAGMDVNGCACCG